MSTGKVGVAYRFWLGASLGSGLLASGIASGDFTVTVRNPGDSVTMAAPTVTEVGATGLYRFDILAAFSTTNGVGQYGVHVEVDSTSPRSRGVITDAIDFFVNDVDDDVQVGGINTNVITAAAIATDAIGSDELAATAIAEIADGVWDEDIVAAHGAADAAGLLLRVLGDAISDRANNATLNALLGVADSAGSDLEGNVRGADDRDLSELAGAGWVAGTDTLEEIRDAITTAGTPATIADAVWDEARAGHVGAGSFGEGVLVQSVNSGAIVTASYAANAITAAVIADGAIDAATFAAGAIDAAAIATGAVDADALASDAVAEIADGVWDEDIVAAHGAASAAGLLLRVLGAAVSTRANNATLDALLGVADTLGTDLPEQVNTELETTAGHGTGLWTGAAAVATVAVADAVWDELRAGHVAAGSFGEGVLVQTVNVGGILATSFAAGAIDAAAIATDAIDADAIATDAFGALELGADAVQEIVDGVWDEVLLGAHTTVDSAALMMRELWQIHGLDDSNPLVVDSSTPAGTRQVPASGSIIDQTVATSGNVTTITRL